MASRKDVEENSHGTAYIDQIWIEPDLFLLLRPIDDGATKIFRLVHFHLEMESAGLHMLVSSARFLSHH